MPLVIPPLPPFAFLESGPSAALNASAMYVNDVGADVANNTGAFVSCGVLVPVLQPAHNFIVRYVVIVSSSPGAAGGVQFRLQVPAGGLGYMTASGSKTAYASPTGILIPGSSGVLVDFDASATLGVAYIDAIILSTAANGNIDLQFKNVTGGQNYIVKLASWVVAHRVS